jgi:serine kinase of HPr protein (carbohydrate metabolism regulator)
VIVHAGLVARRFDGRWRGALIEGPSGCGKSDLALRAIEAGFRLVADDRVLLWTSGGCLFGRAPDPLAGLIEVRGQDVVRESALAFCQVALVTAPGAPDRIPEPAFVERLDVRLPQFVLPYAEASAPAKLSRAMVGLYLSGEKRM